MYKTFKDITIGNDVENFPTLSDAKNSLGFAEKINNILGKLWTVCGRN
jgi:hypothetical protein